MTLDWANIIEQLSRVRIYDYFKNRSMPKFVEPLINDLMKGLNSDPNLRDQLFTAASPDISMVLGWYARKLAGRAVRERSLDDLRNGLVAIAISASRGDSRNALAPLALLYNSASLLREDISPLFHEATLFASQQTKILFEAFLKRPAAEKNVGVFGFSEGKGPEGFDYVPLLAEFGGPTPLGIT